VACTVLSGSVDESHSRQQRAFGTNPLGDVCHHMLLQLNAHQTEGVAAALVDAITGGE
jgi:hypothetical protein